MSQISLSRLHGSKSWVGRKLGIGVILQALALSVPVITKSFSARTGKAVAVEVLQLRLVRWKAKIFLKVVYGCQSGLTTSMPFIRIAWSRELKSPFLLLICRGTFGKCTSGIRMDMFLELAKVSKKMKMNKQQTFSGT